MLPLFIVLVENKWKIAFRTDHFHSGIQISLVMVPKSETVDICWGITNDRLQPIAMVGKRSLSRSCDINNCHEPWSRKKFTIFSETFFDAVTHTNALGSQFFQMLPRTKHT